MVNPLSRVGMKNIVNKGPIVSQIVPSREKVSNLDEREEKLILDIIRGQREVVAGVNVNKSISLEEAAARIKNKY